MIEVIEMGSVPLVEKMIIPTLKPQVNALSSPKSSFSWGWIILLIILIGICIVIYLKINEQSYISEIEKNKIDN